MDRTEIMKALASFAGKDKNHKQLAHVFTYPDPDGAWYMATDSFCIVRTHVKGAPEKLAAYTAESCKAGHPQEADTNLISFKLLMRLFDLKTTPSTTDLKFNPELLKPIVYLAAKLDNEQSPAGLHIEFFNKSEAARFTWHDAKSDQKFEAMLMPMRML